MIFSHFSGEYEGQGSSRRDGLARPILDLDEGTFENKLLFNFVALLVLGWEMVRSHVGFIPIKVNM